MALAQAPDVFAMNDPPSGIPASSTCFLQALRVLVSSAGEDFASGTAGPLGRTLGLRPGSVTAAYTLTPLEHRFPHLSKREENFAWPAFGVG